MDRRVVVVGAALLLLSAVIAVQILDPQFGERTPPEVDFSEPPNEVAADAAKQFAYVDYAYRIDIRRNQSEEWRQVRTMEVDYSDREYYKTGPLGESGVVLYGTDAVTFVRPGEEASWRVTSVRETLFPPSVISQPFLTDRLYNSNSSVIAENSSRITIYVDVHPIKVARSIRGNATLSISKDSGLVDSAMVAYKPEPSRTLYLRFRLIETETDVARPDDISFSPREALWDVVRGPIFDL